MLPWETKTKGSLATEPTERLWWYQDLGLLSQRSRTLLFPPEGRLQCPGLAAISHLQPHFGDIDTDWERDAGLPAALAWECTVGGGIETPPGNRISQPPNFLSHPNGLVSRPWPGHVK